jgi:His/Glu/Gln/Arg/opine family amino acid ABC transporter permease subunit
MGFSITFFLQEVMPMLVCGRLGCSSGWHILSESPIILALLLTIIPCFIGNLLAVPLAMARVYGNMALRTFAYFYILFMRGTPLLVQIYVIYYGFGQLVPGEWMRTSWASSFLREAFYYAIVAFSLNVAGYTGEILRGAIQAVPHGEIEAGKAFGMTPWQIFHRITLPRAIRICLPAMSGETISMLKATVLASTITVYEVLGTANFIRSQTLRTYEPLLGAAIIYIIMVFGLTRFLYWLERRLNKDRQAVVSVAAKPATA